MVCDFLKSEFFMSTVIYYLNNNKHYVVYFLYSFNFKVSLYVCRIVLYITLHISFHTMSLRRNKAAKLPI